MPMQFRHVSADAMSSPSSLKRLIAWLCNVTSDARSCAALCDLSKPSTEITYNLGVPVMNKCRRRLTA